MYVAGSAGSPRGMPAPRRYRCVTGKTRTRPVVSSHRIIRPARAHRDKCSTRADKNPLKQRVRRQGAVPALRSGLGSAAGQSACHACLRRPGVANRRKTLGKWRKARPHPGGLTPACLRQAADSGAKRRLPRQQNVRPCWAPSAEPAAGEGPGMRHTGLVAITRGVTACLVFDTVCGACHRREVG